MPLFVTWSELSKDEFDKWPIQSRICKSTIDRIDQYCSVLPDYAGFSEDPLSPIFVIAWDNANCFDIPKTELILEGLEPLPELKGVEMRKTCVLFGEPQPLYEYDSLQTCNQYRNNTCCHGKKLM